MDEQQQNQQASQPSQAPQGGKSDVDQNKMIAIIGYIVPILFFVPLVTDAKNSPFAKFHANQHLILLISWVIVNIVGGMIPVLGWMLLPILDVVLIIFAIMGLISASKGEMKPMPLIGGISIIK